MNTFKRQSTKLFILASLLAIVHSLSSFAGDPPFAMPAAYSVEMETTAAGNKTQTKMYADEKKTRTETEAGGVKSIVIGRLDKKVTYMLMPAQKMYMETPMSDAQTVDRTAQAKWEDLGSESVNGTDCKKYKATMEAGGQTLVSIYFIDKDKHIVRVVGGEGARAYTVDYKNLNVGAPDASLFEVPSDYSKAGGAASTPASNSNASKNEEPKSEPAKTEPKKKFKLF